MARIVTQSTTAETAASAKAGIMIRDNLTAVNSLNATVDRTPNSVVEFIRRSVTTTNAVATTLPNLSLPRTPISIVVFRWASSKWRPRAGSRFSIPDEPAS